MVTPLDRSSKELAATQAEAFLVDHWGAAVQQVVPIGHGEWSTAFAFRHGDGEYVVRFGSFPEDFAKDRIAVSYANRELPVPAIIEIGQALGRHYAISKRANGDHIDGIDGTEMRAVLPSLFAVLDAARHVELTTRCGYGPWGGDGNAPHPTWRAALLDVDAEGADDRIHGWRDRLATSDVGTGPFDEALWALHSLVECCPEERHLIHSDLLHFNVLVADDRISAVLDWGCSLYGDFLYDVAWFAYWAPWYPAWRDIDFPREAARHYESIGLAVPNFEERLCCYQVHIGLDAQKYNAFTGNLTELSRTAERTLDIARRCLQASGRQWTVTTTPFHGAKR